MENKKLNKKIENNQSSIYKIEHKEKFRVSNSKFTIFLEIDYQNNQVKILPSSNEKFYFIGKDLKKWKIINLMISEAIEFAEKKLKGG